MVTRVTVQLLLLYILNMCFSEVISLSSIYGFFKSEAPLNDVDLLNSFSKGLNKFHNPSQFVIHHCVLQICDFSRKNEVLVSIFKYSTNSVPHYSSFLICSFSIYVFSSQFTF